MRAKVPPALPAAGAAALLAAACWLALAPPAGAPAAAGTTTTTTTTTTTPAPAPDRLQTRLTALQTQLEALQIRLTALESSSAATAASATADHGDRLAGPGLPTAADGRWPDGSRTGGPPAPADDAPDLSASPPDGGERWRRTLALAEDRLLTEPVDYAWADEAQTAVERLFAGGALHGATLAALDCRSTLCRLDVLHDDAGSLDEFDIAWTQQLADVLPRATLTRTAFDDGGVHTSIYLARAGHRLPAPGPTR